MSMYDQFKTDPGSEQDGIWIDYGDFRVKIAYAGGANKKFQKEMERLARPYRRAIATDSLPPELAEKMLRSAYARTIIRGWETRVDGELRPGIENPAGGLMEASVENIQKTFEDLPTLFEDLRNQAGSWALFKASLREEASGN